MNPIDPPAPRVRLLESRLNELAQTLESDPNALALLGLGSAGRERERLDPWSDLDFFVIVRPQTKAHYLEDPSWLNRVHPVSYLFKNSPDGFKLLFADGIFGEMAVFEPQEMEKIPFTEGQVIWSKPDFDQGILQPQNLGGRWAPVTDQSFAVGELLTCLYVGLCRYRRGEKLSAWRFIQGYCLDRVLELASLRWTPEPGLVDPYNRERRVEQLYPRLKPLLPRILGGYEATPQAALAYLEWVEEFETVNPALRAEIVNLAQGVSSGKGA